MTINDPLMGSIADHTKTKHGSYRPYMMAAAIPLRHLFGSLFCSAWMVLQRQTGLGIRDVPAVCHIFNHVPDALWIAVKMWWQMISKNATMLGAFRDWGALQGFLLNMFAVTIITHFSASDQKHGQAGVIWLWASSWLSAYCVPSVAYSRDEGKDRTLEGYAWKLHKSLKSIGQNKPALCILFMVFFINSFVAFEVRSLLIMRSIIWATRIWFQWSWLPCILYHYLACSLSPNWLKWWAINECSSSAVSGLQSSAAVYLWPRNRHDPRRSFHNLWRTDVSGVLPTSGAVYPNVADYGEWKINQSAKDRFFWTGYLCHQISRHSTYLVGWLLDWGGYVIAGGTGGSYRAIYLHLANGVLYIPVWHHRHCYDFLYNLTQE